MSGTENGMPDARFRDTAPVTPGPTATGPTATGPTATRPTETRPTETGATAEGGPAGAGGAPDASDRPLRLTADTADDLAIVSALVQDAVARAGEIAWMPRRRRLAMLLNRFRWEDLTAAEREGRPYERVRACLLFDGVLRVRGRGIDPRDRAAALSLLRIDFAPEPREGTAGGRVTLSLAGGGEIALEVECIEARLVDLSRPWEAGASSAPDHRLDEPS
jgi:hypothetical protein